MKHWTKPMAAAIVIAGLSVAAQQAQANAPHLQLFPGEPGGPFNNDPLTGQWKFTFVVSESKVYTTLPPGFGPPVALPAGIVADSGFVTWHDDGTDLIHSSHVPATDAVAEGTWRRVGNTYQMNDWALPWMAPPAVGFPAFQGPANIQEWLALDKGGQTYSGTFKITLYLASPAQGSNPLQENESVIPGQFVFDTTGGKALEIIGTVKGERVTWNGFPHDASLDP